ncbi:hypothetical protein A6A05_19745 [Magnetospirillum moscoviense]|uniref:Uncharacterized protein n=1 Tax=Magnetospirillum moscoviense TaxID=1437059 RepID=A0A178MVM5_9PROT|nr:hypothetical protein A6A05_19745 [Magnetospirillum moscoviense]
MTSDHIANLLKPTEPAATKILYLAEYAPDHPVYDVKPYLGDGGYPGYHFDIFATLQKIGYSVYSSSKPYSVIHSAGNVDFVFSLYNRMPFKNSEVFVSSYCEFIRMP